MDKQGKSPEISVGICDDEEKLLPYIGKKTKILFNLEGYEPNYHFYTSADSFLDELSSADPLNVVFLDISMPGTDGLSLAQKIRRIWNDTYIIFISAKEDMVFHTFESRPFYFVRKRLFDHDLQQAIRQLCTELKEKDKSGTIVLDVQNEQFQFVIKDILYIEAADKYLNIVSKKRETLLRYRISEIETILKPHGFIRIHKSYLVNCRYIFLIKDKCVLLDNKKELPLSRRRFKQVQQEFREYIQ